MKAIDRVRLAKLMEREEKRFVVERPKSAALFSRARKSLLGGVPMNWISTSTRGPSARVSRNWRTETNPSGLTPDTGLGRRAHGLLR
jgi:hypothetical protein